MRANIAHINALICFFKLFFTLFSFIKLLRKLLLLILSLLLLIHNFTFGILDVRISSLWIEWRSIDSFDILDFPSPRVGPWMLSTDPLLELGLNIFVFIVWLFFLLLYEFFLPYLWLHILWFINSFFCFNFNMWLHCLVLDLTIFITCRVCEFY